jgi:hypothetical protein
MVVEEDHVASMRAKIGGSVQLRGHRCVMPPQFHPSAYYEPALAGPSSR